MACTSTLHLDVGVQGRRSAAGRRPGAASVCAPVGGAHRLVASPARASRPSRRPLQVQAFKFLKQLGLKKPAFLPDFGLRKRLDVLHRFFGPIDRRTYDELLAPDFTIVEDGVERRRYSRAEWIDLMCNHVSMSIPDFCWTAATDGVVADDGYAVVTVQAVGHHTGTPLALSNLPPVPPSGKRFSLQPELMKVKVEDGKIKEIVAFKGEHTGPLALYKELQQLANMQQAQ